MMVSKEKKILRNTTDHTEHFHSRFPKSCAHLVFCMRVTNGTSWSDAPRTAIAKSGDA